MSESPKQQTKTFETDHRYAIVSGWLILPVIYSASVLFSALIMLIFVNPSVLSGFDSVIYWTDVIFLPILLVTYYFWWKRKKTLPYLMMMFFLLIALREIVYMLGDAAIDYFTIAVSILWIVYFYRSQRVKQTFIN